jgi:hypothetical protein
MPAIEWRPVVGWEGWYEVSSEGEVRRVRQARGVHSAGNTLRRHANAAGYLYVRLTRDSRSNGYLVHRLVAEAFLGPCPERHEVNHLDLDRANATVSNLEYVTRSQNIRHARLNGTPSTPRGSEKSQAKLTEGDVVVILLSTDSHRSLAKRFRVHHSVIGNIKRRKKWRHVTLDEVRRALLGEWSPGKAGQQRSVFTGPYYAGETSHEH